MVAKGYHAQLVVGGGGQPGVFVDDFRSSGDGSLLGTRRGREEGGNLSVAAFDQVSFLGRIATVVDGHKVESRGGLILGP